MKRLVYTVLRLASAVLHGLRRRCTRAGQLAVGVMLTAAVIGIDTTISLTHQVFSFAAALLLVAMIGALRFPARFEVRRELPEFSTVGEPVRYRVEVRNVGAHAARDLRLLEELADPRPTYEMFARRGLGAAVAHWRARPRSGAATRIPESTLPPLAPGERCEVTVAFTPRRRGAVELTSSTVARADPLGLFRALRGVDTPGSLLVLPARFVVPELALPGTRVHQPGGVSLASSVGDSEEFFGLRDYRPGDPLQRVHWKSFARTGKPVVKEFQDEFFERHALVLDTFGEADAPVLEDAVALAASFASTVDTHESLLDLLFVGAGAYCYTAGRGLLQVESLLEVLAHVQPSDAGSFASLREAVLERRERLSGCILVLVAWDDTRRAFVDELRAGGLAVIAFVVTEDAVLHRAPPDGVQVLRAGHVEADLAS